MLKTPMHRQVLRLATAQALFQWAAVMVMATGGLAGATVAPNPQLATLPVATMLLLALASVLATAVLTGLRVPARCRSAAA